MRRCIHLACILGFIVSAGSGYWLAEIATGTTAVAADSIGFLTCMQYSLAALCMLGAWATTPATTMSAADALGAGNPVWCHWLLLGGLVARLILVPVDSYTSNDTERYLWDGSVAADGHDPYRTSPNDREVADLRERWPTPPEHAHYPTLYPPLAIATFAAVSTAGPELAPVRWKWLTTAAGLATLLLAIPLLERAGHLRHLALVALSPILVLESGIGAHVDAFSVLALTAALLAWQRGCYVCLGVLLGIGALYKLLPILLLLPVVLSLRNARRSLRVIAGALATIVAGYGGALIAGWHPIGILPVFFEKWRFGSPVFAFLETLFSGTWLVIVTGMLTLGGLTMAGYIARRSAIHGAQCTLAVPLLLSPVVFPWYLSVLVPLAALAPSAWLVGWLCALPLTYEVLGGFISKQVWMPADWPLYAITASWLIGLLGFSIKRAVSVRHHPDRQASGGGFRCRWNSQ